MERKAGVEASRVFEMASLVEYGEGAVVSRTLLDGEAGSVTLFAFDAGEGLSEHSTPFDALVLVIDGEGEFTIGGEPLSVRDGELILMPAGIAHAVRADVRMKMVLTMIRDESEG